jgi:endoglucanase
MSVADRRRTMRFALIALFVVGCVRANNQARDGAVAGADMATSSEPGDMALGGAGDIASPPDLSDARPLPALPLHTSGRWIEDAKSKRFKLASVNWYGADEADYVVAGLDRQPLAAIAKRIADYGFNSVRLPWSNELVEKNPIVADARLAANPELRGRHALEVLDAVIAALAHEGIVVILDNHVSTAIWCCANGDVNALWYNGAYPESSWLADWKTIAKRYADQPAVVAADLRNELRGSVTWGSGDPTTDWRLAAKKGGDAVLSVNPNLLVIVEGLGYSLDFTAVSSTFGTAAQTDKAQTFFAVANRLVWSPHDYSFDHNGIVSYDGAQPALKTQLGNKWGYLLVQGQPYTAPVWVGEFGTCNTDAKCIDSASNADAGFWFAGLRRYLHDADIDWCYWPWNGTAANGGAGSGRTVDTVETYGVLNPTWTGPSLPSLLSGLKAIQPATQGPP